MLALTTHLHICCENLFCGRINPQPFMCVSFYIFTVISASTFLYYGNNCLCVCSLAAADAMLQPNGENIPFSSHSLLTFCCLSQRFVFVLCTRRKWWMHDVLYRLCQSARVRQHRMVYARRIRQPPQAKERKREKHVRGMVRASPTSFRNVIHTHTHTYACESRHVRLFTYGKEMVLYQ